MPLISGYENRYDGRLQTITAFGRTYQVGPSEAELMAAKRDGYYPEMPKRCFPRSCPSMSASRPTLDAKTIESLKKRGEKRRVKEMLKKNENINRTGKKETIVTRNEFGVYQVEDRYRKPQLHSLRKMIQTLQCWKGKA